MPAPRTNDGPSYVKVTRFTDREWSLITSAANEAGLNTSEFIRKAIRQYLQGRQYTGKDNQ